MSKRVSFYGLIGLVSLCIFFLAFNQHYGGYLEHRLQPIISDVDIRPHISKVPETFTTYVKTTTDNVSWDEILDVVHQQRRIIQNEMEGYSYPNGRYGLNVSKLEDLISAKGGKPIRSVIVTSWRSGSTFLGDILNAHPANFYHYEPLLDFGIVRIRGSPLAEKVLKIIESLLRCDFSDLDRYFTYGKTHTWIFSHNTRLWHQCQAHKKICWASEFVSSFCKLFPFQSMKLVRLRLIVAAKLLAVKDLGIRLVHLVRDPRGILQSRRHRDWCPSSPDCYDPALVCADMVSDFEAAVTLTNKYPDSFRVVRYEDLSVDPYTHVKELFSFYGLDFHENVKRFLDTHTKSDAGGVSSTFRNSKVTPFHWQADLEYEEVDQIQRVCEPAMALWGYILASNATHQKEFNPLTDYKLEL